MEGRGWRFRGGCEAREKAVWGVWCKAVKAFFVTRTWNLIPKSVGTPVKQTYCSTQAVVQSKARHKKSLDGALVGVEVQCSLVALLLKPIQTHS